MAHIVKLADIRVGGVYCFPVLHNSMTLYNSIAEFVRIGEVTNTDSFAVLSVCPVVMKKSSGLDTLGYTFTKYGVLTSKGVSGELFICDQQNITVECVAFNAPTTACEVESLEPADIPDFSSGRKQNGWSLDILLEMTNNVGEGLELDLTMGALFPSVTSDKNSVVVSPKDLTNALLTPGSFGHNHPGNILFYYRIHLSPPGQAMF